MGALAPGAAPLVLIAGPTAGGKSALALELARACGGIIVNADAMQVYRELRVLTARPGPAEEGAAPHRLYGTVPARQAWSAGAWLAAAREAIAAARQAGTPAIVVGGTGLYFSALLGGLAEIPPIAPEIRAAWRERLAAAGLAALRRDLAARDPVMAAAIAPSDSQRTLRALEVLEATGRSLADWQEDGQEDGAKSGAMPDRMLRLVVAPERAELYRRIDARAAAMLDAGAVDEVAGLLALGLATTAPAMKAIGVREIGDVLSGATGLDEALDRMRRATRHYAKRQLTWSRGRMADWRSVAGPQEGLAVALEHCGRA